MFTREEEPSEESEEAERAQPLVFVSPSAAQARVRALGWAERVQSARSPVASGADGRDRGRRSRGGPQRGSAAAARRADVSARSGWEVGSLRSSDPAGSDR